MKYYLMFLAITFLFLVSCESEETVEKPQQIDWDTDKSVEFGKSLTKGEEVAIKIYLKQRTHWDVKETGTGLRYWIYEANEGPRIQEGQTIDVRFEVKLLNDSLCYKSEGDEVSSFVVDKADVESGIMEGVKYLTKGDRAKFIIPSHIGHGLLGDLKNIPPLEVLVVDLKIVDVR